MALMVEAMGDLREMVIRLMEVGLMGCMMGAGMGMGGNNPIIP